MAKSREHQYQLFDALRPEEYAALEKDILARGVMVPVEVDENGTILDGHNRVEIADKHGLKYKTIVRKFKTEQEKRDHVRKLNLLRRQLTPHVWGKHIKDMLEERGIERGKRGPKSTDSNSPTMSEIAGELGIGASTARRYMHEDDKFESLPSRSQEAVKAGEATIKEEKSRLRKEATTKKEAKAAKKAAASRSRPWTLTTSQKVVKCAALVTDPPYGILDEPWEPKKLQEFTVAWAARWAKCGADFIVTFWSQRHLWTGKRWFDKALVGYSFQQMLVWCCPNNKSPQSRRGFKQTWEPILFYRRDDSDKQITIGGGEWGKGLTDFDHHVAAVPQENFNDENMKQHPAQKPVSVMLWLVNTLTEPGELVCDPFCGSGTTGIAAMQLGRRFHGIDTGKDYLEIAKGRIESYGVQRPKD